MNKFFVILVSLIFDYANSFAYESFADLKVQADNGNPVAQYDLGKYYIGNHSQANYQQSLKYLRLSSKEGYSLAKDLIHELTSKGYNGWGDFDLLPWYDFSPLSAESEKELNNRSSEGTAGASLELAHNFYFHKDYVQALKYYNLTLKQINPEKELWYAWEDSEAEGSVSTMKLEDVKIMMDAITRIAYCYEHGYGVQKDETKAIAYYEMFGGYNADLGYSETASTTDVCAFIKELLLFYNNPTLNEYVGECGGQIYDGFAPSPESSRAWSKISILKLKYLNSTAALKDILQHEQITSDPQWDTSAGSIWNLWAGEIYYKGIGVDKDYNNAFQIFNYLINEAKGPWNSELSDYYPEAYADACYRLYECYAFGRGVNKDSTKASHYFKEALIFGSSSAIYDDQKRYETLNQ